MPKRSRSGLVRSPGARRRADQREFREVDFHRARGGAFADDEIELEILHRRIEHFLHHRREAMNFINEQNVALFQIGEQCREIARFRDHRARRGAKADAHFARHDLRQSCFAKAGRADEQHMIERLIPLLRRLDEHREIGARLFLPDKIVERLRTQRGIRVIALMAFGGEEAPSFLTSTPPGAPTARPPTRPNRGGGTRPKKTKNHTLPPHLSIHRQQTPTKRPLHPPPPPPHNPPNTNPLRLLLLKFQNSLNNCKSPTKSAAAQFQQHITWASANTSAWSRA